jgi:hypothetical protein
MRLSSTVLAFSSIVPMAASAQTLADPAPANEPAPTAEPTPANPTAAAPTTIALPAPLPALAAPTEVTTPPAPTPSIVFAGEALVDAYYLYNFTGDPKTQVPAFRQFDTTANSFTLNYAKLGVHAETNLVSFRIDAGAGHTAAIINGASSAASTGTPAPAEGPGVYSNGFLLQQAFATVKLLPSLSVDAGKFVTSASAEVIESNKNWLYSRSLLFFGVPLLHTGLRLNATLHPALTASIQIVNGWNNDPDINSDKTFGANVTFAPPNAGLLASLTAYAGKEGGADGSNTRVLLDGVFSKDLGSLSLGANVDYVKLGSANWFGVSGMGRFIFNDLFNLALRGEYLRSKNGAYSPADGAIYEITGQGAFTVDKHYELRLELRADLSDEEIFVEGATPRKNQVTGLVAALAYF